MRVRIDHCVCMNVCKHACMYACVYVCMSAYNMQHLEGACVINA